MDDLTGINLNLLLALQALLEERSVTAAARRLGVTQSAMSRQLAQLRYIFADPLLVRVGNRQQLTERARQLSPALDTSLNSIRQLLHLAPFNPAQCVRRFHIAVSDYEAHYILPEATEQLIQQAPDIELMIHPWTPDQMPALREGGLDMAACILEASPPDIHGRAIDSDHFVCLMRHDHPLAERSVLTLGDYVNTPQVAISGGGDKVRQIDSLLNDMKRQRRIQVWVPFIDAALSLVSASNLVTTVPRHIADNLAQQFQLVARALPFQSPRISYYLIWHSRHQHDPAHQFVRDHLFKALQGSHYSH